MVRWPNAFCAKAIPLPAWRAANPAQRRSEGRGIYAENGEEALKDVAAAISRMLGFGGKTRAWTPQEAEAALGPKAHSSFGSNSRVRGGTLLR